MPRSFGVECGVWQLKDGCWKKLQKRSRKLYHWQALYSFYSQYILTIPPIQYVLKDFTDDFLPPFYSKEITKPSKDFTLNVEYSPDDDEITRKKKCCKAALYKKCWKKAKRQDELFDAQLENLTTQTMYYRMMIDRAEREEKKKEREEKEIKMIIK